MAIGKFWLWGQTGSVGVLASLVHSALDMFGAIASFIAVRYAARTPNPEYRYGFGKAESFSAVFQVCLIVPFAWADALVGGLMALWLLFTAFQIARLAWGQLMDKELNSDERRAIERLAMHDPQVRAVTELRTRAAGPHLHIQMRLDLDETLSLADAHEIILETEKRIIADFPAADILIHPHPAGCHHKHGNKLFQTDTKN